MKHIIHNKTKAQISEKTIWKSRNGFTSEVNDFIAIESPLQIEINNKPVSITMRTPGDDPALALGFLFTEGIINNYDLVLSSQQKDENVVNILMEDKVEIDLSNSERNFYSTSSCGVCGKSSVDAIITKSNYLIQDDETLVKESVLYSLLDKLSGVQSGFEATGGLHASALFNPEGRFMFHSEDVGRHNALDKLIGHALMADRIPLKKHILLLSGRISFELVQKASMAGIPIVVAVGAPSSLAIELAEKNGQTLIGFLKKNSYNIYTGHQRIQH